MEQILVLDQGEHLIEIKPFLYQQYDPIGNATVKDVFGLKWSKVERRLSKSKAPHVVWFKFHVVNPDSVSIDKVFSVPYDNIYDLRIFHAHDGEIDT